MLITSSTPFQFICFPTTNNCLNVKFLIVVLRSIMVWNIKRKTTIINKTISKVHFPKITISASRHVLLIHSRTRILENPVSTEKRSANKKKAQCTTNGIKAQPILLTRSA